MGKAGSGEKLCLAAYKKKHHAIERTTMEVSYSTDAVDGLLAELRAEVAIEEVNRTVSS